MTTQIQTPADERFASLAAGLTGALHLPGTPRYAELAQPWNVAVVNVPVAVVEAKSATDVVSAVRFAADSGRQVSVQCTGHGAVEADRPALQVNTTALRELTISPTGAVRAGAGLQWRDIIDAAAPYGFAALAGSAPGVGVVGFLTGGGIGPVARTYGVSSDYVTAFEVVTGDGQLRRATATEYPDLFWALRGGKGSLGIVTAVEFDLAPLTELLAGCLYFHADDTASVLHTWRRWTASLPAAATTSVAIMRLPAMPGVPEPLAGTVTVAVRFAWVGDPDEGRRVLEPVRSAGRVVFGTVEMMPYAAVGLIHNDPVDPMPTYEASTLLQSLPFEAVEAILRGAGPAANCPQIIVELRQLGGAIDRPQNGDGAFDRRPAEYSFLTIGIAAPPVLEATATHAAAMLAALGAWSDGTCLPNFQSSADPAQVARKYQASTLSRLAQLAGTYDPQQVIAAANPFLAAAS